jgi:hypothetical protein
VEAKCLQTTCAPVRDKVSDFDQSSEENRSPSTGQGMAAKEGYIYRIPNCDMETLLEGRAVDGRSSYVHRV